MLIWKIDGYSTFRKIKSDRSIRQTTRQYIPELCQTPENSETEQGSGKKLDNDGVRQALYQHNNQRTKTWRCFGLDIIERIRKED